jgi:flagellar hook-associated protein 2
LTQLSGYGQLLSSTSQFSASLAAASANVPTTPQAAGSSAPTVATATYGPGSTATNYTLAVSQVAAAQTVKSAYFSDPNALVGPTGSFNIQTGSVNGNGTFTSDGTTPTTVNVSTPTLNGIAAAINGTAGSPVTATVINDSFGYRLQITDNTIGAGNNFSISSDGTGPFGTFQQGLSALSLTQTQAAQNASYTVNGGAAQTSTTNTNIAIDTGVNATLLSAGTTTIVTGNYTGVGGAGVAQNLVNAYNALQGNVSVLTGTGGSLNGNPGTANQLATSLQNVAKSTFSNGASSLTTLSQLGITLTTPASATSTLSLNATTLQSAFNSDPAGAANLLTQAVNQLNTVANGYANPANNNPATGIEAQGRSITTAYANGLPAGVSSSLPAPLFNALVLDELSQGSNALGLSGFSTFA